MGQEDEEYQEIVEKLNNPKITVGMIAEGFFKTIGSIIAESVTGIGVLVTILVVLGIIALVHFW